MAGTTHETNDAAADTAMTKAQIAETLQHIADGFRQPRAPILHRPDEEGLEYETVSFPSEDGVPLEGWFIPKPGSDNLIIANHPRWFSRSRLPSHLEPWKSFAGATGNDFEVSFVPDYKLLHDIGYNVLTYDLRNHGQSGAANGGIFTVGQFESRDEVVPEWHVPGRARVPRSTASRALSRRGGARGCGPRGWASAGRSRADR